MSKLIPELSYRMAVDYLSKTFNRSFGPLRKPPSIFLGKSNHLPANKISLPLRSYERLLSQLDTKIKSTNFLGGGVEAEVYRLDNEYVLRMVGGTKSVGNRRFKPVQDIFEGRIFGQQVAVSEDGLVSINRFVPGNKLYKVNDALHNENFNPESYLKTLKRYTELPTNTLENFVDDIAFLNKKGYRIDQSNPGNFLYNPKTGKIGIVDISKKGSSSLDLFEPYSHDWVLDPLVNGHDIFEIYKKMSPNQRKEMFELITKLENRILPLCEKHGIPQAKWNHDDYGIGALRSILHVKDKIDYNNSCLFEPIVMNGYPNFIENLKYFKSSGG